MKLKMKISNPFKIDDGMSRKRRFKDIFRNVSTLIFSLLTLVTLIYIIVYIFANGSSTLSWQFITSDYQEVSTSLYSRSDLNFGDRTFDFNEDGGEISEKWGVQLVDGENNLGEHVVYFLEVADNSYFNELVIGSNTATETYNNYDGQYISNLSLRVDDQIITLSSRDSASDIVNYLDQSNEIMFMEICTVGGGIRGSLLTTIYLILITLIIAIPLGVCAAIYLALYAKKNKFTMILRSLIDMTSAIPSIIFGFIGALVFIPFMNAVSGSNGGSILSGALTLTIMLIPTIVKTTEESIIALPKGYMDSSLALGASRTETVFKVILPNALPGIITSIILSIGRIIGESAALVFAIGVSIQDNISLTGSSTSLAVHIWSLLKLENPNYDAACAISIIILCIVLVLCLLTKIISYRFNKKFKRS